MSDTTTKQHPRTGCVDLDGVLNLYDGWQGPDHFHEPRPDAQEFVHERLAEGYNVCVHTTRDEVLTSEWLAEHGFEPNGGPIKIGLKPDGFAHEGLSVSNRKPPAVWYADDRAVCFRGNFDVLAAELEHFRAHWEEPADDPAPAGGSE